MKIYLIFPLITLFLNSFSQKFSEDGSLDEVKAYVASEKYFKSALKCLHFIIETDKIEDVDKTFNQILATFNLPTEVNDIEDGVYVGESPYDAFDYKHVVKLKTTKLRTLITTKFIKTGVIKNRIKSTIWR